MKPHIPLATLILLGAAFLAHSENAVLDFEPPFPGTLTPASYVHGSTVTAQSVITTQYARFGLLMDGVALIAFPVGSAPSGTTGIVGFNPQMQVDYDRPLTFTFVSPLNNATKSTMDFFSIYPDTWNDSDNSVTVSAYDLDGHLVGTALYQETGVHQPRAPIVLSGIGRFHRVVVDSTLHSATSGGIGFDLVSFGPILPQPHPSIRCSQVEICWESATNATYQLQYRSTLTTNQWVAFGAPVQGDGTRQCVTDAVVADQPQRFYRILPVP